jgi:hypothetical protein
MQMNQSFGKSQVHFLKEATYSYDDNHPGGTASLPQKTC